MSADRQHRLRVAVWNGRGGQRMRIVQAARHAVVLRTTNHRLLTLSPLSLVACRLHTPVGSFQQPAAAPFALLFAHVPCRPSCVAAAVSAGLPCLAGNFPADCSYQRRHGVPHWATGRRRARSSPTCWATKISTPHRLQRPDVPARAYGEGLPRGLRRSTAAVWCGWGPVLHPEPDSPSGDGPGGM